MSELAFPQLAGRAQQCLGHGWKLGLAGLPAPSAVACETPPSRPVVPQRWWVAPCSLSETSPGPECSSLERARAGDKLSKGLQPAEVTCAVPPYRAWQRKRSRRPRPCSRVGVHLAMGAARPRLDVGRGQLGNEHTSSETSSPQSPSLSCCASPEEGARVSSGKWGNKINKSPWFICQASLLAVSFTQVGLSMPPAVSSHG